ncbi:MAG: FtsW/RodA/SpoVE family cell cycle protein [Cyclobacteriaceae bacterium]|nr:MAG: FtsW/RodA/SpoVE family cell cycle protein [Cyclobacteriaceae bacterium]
MSREADISGKLDWVSVLLYVAMVGLGWLNIFAAVYDETANQSIFDLSLNSGRQLMFIVAAVVIILAIIIIDMRFYEAFAYIFYAIILVVLVMVPLIGKEVGGNKSWIGVGSFGVQPSEFAKFITALAVAKFIGSVGFRMDSLRNQAVLFAMILFPLALILLQKILVQPLYSFLFGGLLPRGYVAFYSDSWHFNGSPGHSYINCKNQWYLHGIIGAVVVVLIFLENARLSE